MRTVHIPGRLTRFVRGHGLVGSALCRRTDRVEAVVVVVLALLAMVMAPLAATIALGVYQRDTVEAAASTAQRTKVTATLVENAVQHRVPSAERGGSPPASARVQWEFPQGQLESEILPVAAGQRAGDQVAIWVDRAGHHADAPMTHGDTLVSALVIAVDVVLLGWLLLGLMWWMVSRGLNRINAAQWDVEWARHGPGWSHRSWQ